MNQFVTEVLSTSLPITSHRAAPRTIEGKPTIGDRALHSFAGPTTVGVWELTPGTVEDVEIEEIFVVLHGRATITVVDGPTIDVSAGSVVRLEAGQRTTWVVTETLRKIYIAQEQ